MGWYRIKAVSHMTGIRPELLRMWERRYRLFTPHRSGNRYREYNDEDVVIDRGEKVDAALYFVRKGSVTLETKGQETQTIESGGYFGEKNMLLDQNKNSFDFRK